MIELDKYQIESDSKQYILRQKLKHGQDHPKTPGREYLSQPKFYPSFTQCLNEMMNDEMLRLTSQDRESLQDISASLKEFGIKVQAQIIKALV